MSMHAKSLNQLAAELERGHCLEPSSQAPTPAVPCSPETRLTEQLDRLAKVYERLCAPGASPASTPEPVQASSPTSPAPPTQAPFCMDTTLGTRLHREEEAQISKREAEVRLYAGFISRAGIQGKD